MVIGLDIFIGWLAFLLLLGVLVFVVLRRR